MTTQQKFNLKLLYKLPEEIEQYILQYLSGLKEQIRKHCIYVKYYKKCYLSLNTFTYQEINRYFHKEDYFGISTNKNLTITNYINYNLYLSEVELIDDEKYEKLKTIIICSNIRSAILRMKSRYN